MSVNLALVPTFMRDQADIAARVLIDELGLDAARANAIGLRISREVCTEHAGELVYIARGLALEIKERDREMYAFYCRCDRDVNQTAREFKLSVKQVYERIRMVEAANQAKNQGGLFDDDDPADAPPDAGRPSGR